MKEFVLLKDIDWFGRQVLSGTIYRQINADYYHPNDKWSKMPINAGRFLYGTQ